jgi:hypothetical protein
MALSKIGLLAVKGTKGIAKKIAANQGISKQAAYQWISGNHENLTRDSVVTLIVKETGLLREQILERETTEAATK